MNVEVYKMLKKLYGLRLIIQQKSFKNISSKTIENEVILFGTNRKTKNDIILKDQMRDRNEIGKKGETQITRDRGTQH